MHELIQLLKVMENYAFDVYALASSYYKDDKQLSSFLDSLSGDEALHYHYISSAGNDLDDLEPPVKSEIILDEATQEKVLRPLKQCKNRIRKNNLSRELLYQYIIEAEFSEWNDIFLYVTNTFKARKPVFQHAASKIQAHHRKMVRFFEKLNTQEQLLEKIKSTKKIWDTRILIADDNDSLRSLLEALFDQEVQVDTVENGALALSQSQSSFYDLIISDIDMPVMDGIQFYQKVKSVNKEQAERFIFITGKLTGEKKTFLDKEGVMVLEKPFPIKEIQARGNAIINKE